MAGPVLDNVGDYLAESRRLLQDEITPYRYPDEDLVVAMNIGLAEVRRLRADLLLPQFVIPYLESTTIDLAAKVPLHQMYRSSLVYYIVGRAQLRDDEATQDARAASLLTKFVAQMIQIGA